MVSGDPEPPTLQKTEVLKNAMYKFLKEQYVDPKPRLSLEIMKETTLGNIIHEVGLNPFFVFFWTLAQSHAYLSCAENAPVSVSIDASGSIVKKIRLANKSLSGPTFLYLIVTNTEAEQISICQMLSEKHTRIAIAKWLMATFMNKRGWSSASKGSHM